MNGDGHIDVVAAGTSELQFAVSLGDGSGGLAEPTLFPLTQRPTELLLSDLNGDMHVDVIGFSSRGISISLAVGDGTFAAPTDVTVPGFLTDIVIADFNNDGKPDLVVSDFEEDVNPASVLLGNGDGTFAEPLRVTTSIEIRTNVALLNTADLNNDGNHDLVIASSRPNNIMITMFGNGDGTFTESELLTTELNPKSPVLHDFDQDGNVDLAYVHQSADNIHLRFNDGSGLFPTIQSIPSGRRDILRIADIDNNGTIDLVSGTHLNVTSWPGVGDGTFGAPTNITAAFSQSVEFADLDQDGNLDLLLPDNSGVYRMLGRGDGTFPTLTSTTVTPSTHADIDGDGDADLLTISPANVTVLRNDGDLVFTNVGTLSPGFSSLSIGRVEVADVNNDGHRDVVGIASDSRTTTGRLQVWLANGSGGYAPRATSYSITSWGRGIDLADLNADGNLDAVVAVGRELSGGVFRSVDVLLGDGTGVFAAPVRMDMPVGPYSVRVTDVNNDNVDDIVTGNNANSISVFIGNGDGTFQARTDFSLTHRAGSVIHATDLDGDGNIDIVVNNRTSTAPGASVLLGNGDGTFQPSFGVGTGGSSFLFVTDVTRDEIPDLIIDRFGVQVFPGVGDGTFDTPLSYGLVNARVVVDIDGDDDPDILGASAALIHNAGIQAVTLRLDESAQAAGTSEKLEQRELDVIADAAVQRWSSLGLSEPQLATLGNVKLRVADLSGSLLGYAFEEPTSSVIWIDSNAAGAGWFVDSTPDNDEEFHSQDGQMVARDPADSQRVDLLTAVMHELGHILGLPDHADQDSHDDLMYAWLQPGVRKSPLKAELADELFGDL